MSVLIAALCCGVLTGNQSSDKANIYKQKGTLSGVAYSLELIETKFKLGSRKLFWVKSGESEVPATGTPAKPKLFFGHDLGKSQLEGKSLQQYFESNFTEIISMKVTWKGRTTTFGKSMFSDLLNPMASKENITVKVGKSGALTIELYGSDGAGGYSALWTVDVKGGIKRKVDLGG